ncbi:MAG: tetratricopeptide repeat protein [Planctomycetes bacterium]|jgi:tetratricopeptide (TPR) repeat protein|nr:tetratricopeptide repeat protein [Planctomycetota bacterium]
MLIVWLLIIISFIIIVLIFIKRLPALAVLDVENMPQEKEVRFKEKMIKEKLQRDLLKWQKYWQKVVDFFEAYFRDPLKKFYENLHDLKRLYELKKHSNPLLKQEKIEDLIEEAEELAKDDSLEAAEKRLIEVITLDDKNAEAFFELGDIYCKDKRYTEAKETLLHALRLATKQEKKELIPEIYILLAEVHQIIGEMDKAIEALQGALSLEPNNPRYLDAMLTLAFIQEDKILALKAYDKLKEANPENQKLDELKDKIREMSL